MLRNPQPTRLTCLMIRLNPSVRALVTCSVSATWMAGHQVSMVVARPGGFVHVGAGAGVVEAPQPVADALRVGLGEQLAQQLLAAPGGADFVGRIIFGQNAPQPGQLAGRETIAGSEQHVPMCPDRVGLDSAAAMTLAGDALADLGDHLVGQPHQVPVIYGDPGVRQRGPDPRGIRRGRGADPGRVAC
jgi:hypothetical protein